MEKQKTKRQSYKTEEQKEMLRFILVLAVVVLLVFVVYFVSKKLIVDKSIYEISYETGAVNYERAIAGTIFNRPESEYYVIVYDETKTDAVYYSAMSSNYVNKQEKALKVYHVDLNSEMNKQYIAKDGKSNTKATKTSELQFKDLTLLKIKNGKIVKYLETSDDIKKELTVTNEKESTK